MSNTSHFSSVSFHYKWKWIDEDYFCVIDSRIWDITDEMSMNGAYDNLSGLILVHSILNSTIDHFDKGLDQCTYFLYICLMKKFDIAYHMMSKTSHFCQCELIKTPIKTELLGLFQWDLLINVNSIAEFELEWMKGELMHPSILHCCSNEFQQKYDHCPSTTVRSNLNKTIVIK